MKFARSPRRLNKPASCAPPAREALPLLEIRLCRLEARFSDPPTLPLSARRLRRLALYSLV